MPLDNTCFSGYTSLMPLLRSRTRILVAAFGLLAIGGIAVVGALFATGEIGGRQIFGEVQITESEFARFDRELRSGLAGANLDPGTDDTGRCLKLAAAEDIAPGDRVVLYNEGGVVIGRGALGRAIQESKSREPNEVIPVCVFRFYIDDIRQTDSVGIEISGTPRATVHASEFEGRRWSVQIPLGS
jgi:hypothetical protein